MVAVSSAAAAAWRHLEAEDCSMLLGSCTDQLFISDGCARSIAVADLAGLTLHKAGVLRTGLDLFETNALHTTVSY